MHKSKSQTLSPDNGSNEGQSSSSPFSSLRRALSGQKNKGGNKEATSEKETEALNDSMAASNPFADPPPAYSSTATEDPADGASTSFQSSPKKEAHVKLSVSTASTTDDPYAFLSFFDTVFLIDDSYSMKDGWPLTRWEETGKALRAIVPICTQHDQDGIDVYFLNNENFMDRKGDPKKGVAPRGYRHIQTPERVEQLFKDTSPSGSTPTAERLGSIIRTYVSRYEAEFKRTKDDTCLNPLNIIVITDGQPNDEIALQNMLIEQAQKLDAISAPYHQVGVQFFQVGNDRQAALSLAKLDDQLGDYVGKGKELRDMVDTSTFSDASGKGELTADDILKVVLGSVVKRLDRKPTRTKNRTQKLI
ncbi:hypothetical protein F5Y19DRAFT_264530 [Xylariaceae sp. FL1651]|nr:hypothetical protein F5Y19DRAFT_264530 [Xylariaceae sp. FL1651]